MTFSTSLFDTSDSKTKLWKKYHTELHQGEKVTFSTIAHKPILNKTEMNSRHFYIQGNLLCYKRKVEDAKYCGCLDLQWTRAKIEETEEPELAQQFEFTLVLMRNKKMTKLYLKNEEERNAWREALRKVCIMTDFHFKYKAVEEIGHGSYASVIFTVF